MSSLLYFSVFLTGLFVLNLFYSQSSFAQCVVTGATPGMGQVVECMGDDPDGVSTTDFPDDVTVFPGANVTTNINSTISTRDGNDRVEILGGTLTAAPGGFDCVFASDGNDVIIMHAGQCSAANDCLDGSDDDDVITLNGGLLECVDDGLDAGNGNDIITATGGTITTGSEPIRAGPDDDHVSVSNVILKTTNDDPEDACINGNDGNDTVRLGTGAECINGEINGAADFDTLVFEMEVPEEAFNIICSQILGQSPQNGSITINDLFYEWEAFELLVCDLQPVRITRPIPTLSEWGLIAMVGVLGLIGLFAIRRRSAAV